MPILAICGLRGSKQFPRACPAVDSARPVRWTGEEEGGGNKVRAASLKQRQSCIKNNKEAKQIKRAHAAGKERGRRDVATSDNGALANPYTADGRRLPLRRLGFAGFHSVMVG